MVLIYFVGRARGVVDADVLFGDYEGVAGYAAAAARAGCAVAAEGLEVGDGVV